MNSAFYLNALGVASALGRGARETSKRLFAGVAGTLPSVAFSPGRALPVGAVLGDLPELDAFDIGFRSRNNSLAILAADQIKEAVQEVVSRYGAHRVAVVVGTSTSGVGESEAAIRFKAASGHLPPGYDFAQQELGTLATFVARYFGATGLTYVHSSACASGAKAMASAARLLQNGLADAVITGGVDSLSEFTIAGFSALNLVSANRCLPLSANRDGINIGEAGALFLMTREPATVRLAGWGESSDGHHFSAPDPTGLGATLAINAAVARAACSARALDYVNLHATGTRANDSMEGAVMHAFCGEQVPVSGTKPLTGHTLGAAGALEAAICWLTMQDENSRGSLPPHLWDGQPDPTIPPLHVVTAGESLSRPPRLTMSTSFAFGGANAALIFGRE